MLHKKSIFAFFSSCPLDSRTAPFCWHPHSNNSRVLLPVGPVLDAGNHSHGLSGLLFMTCQSHSFTLWLSLYFLPVPIVTIGISQSSPGKQNPEDIYPSIHTYIYTERFIWRNWLMWPWALASLKSTGQADSRWQSWDQIPPSGNLSLGS